MPTTAPVPPSQYGLKDLEFEISDAAWEHSEQYWAPIEHIANRYLAFHEATSRIAAGLRTLASVDQDRQEGEFYDIASELAEVDELDVDRWLRAEVKLEDRHEARRDLIVEWIARYVTDRFLEKHARLRTARSVAEVFEWIGLSIATGVSGNLAYDTLKKGWGFGWRGVFRRLRRFPNPSRVDPDEAILYLVKIAIREQCRTAQFPVPEFDSLSIVGWQPGAQSVIAEVQSSSPEMHALVEIPYLELESHGVRISLSRPNP